LPTIRKRSEIDTALADLKDNPKRQIISLMTKSEFGNVKNGGHKPVLFGFGSVAYYQASVLNEPAGLFAASNRP
jgi:hypothetical protein